MTALQLTITDGVAVVTLDRPPVNALTIALYAEIADLFESFLSRSEVNCVVLTAWGSKAFCAGLDLHEFLAASADDDDERAAIVRRCFAAVRHCAVPVIAAVNGPALGAGAVLASVADIRLATPNTRFSLPEINVGRCGGTAHMGRHLPQGVLRHMVFTGLPLSVEDAYRFGFVQEIVEQEQLQARAMELARLISSKAPLGLRLGKESMNVAEFLPVEEGYAGEQVFSTRLMRTEDAREATRAVVGKRAPVWSGR
jgi:enoyl-CoA hydratase